MSILVEIAAGELIDKMTILEIKLDQIGEAGKRANIRREYEQLRGAFSRACAAERRARRTHGRPQSDQS